MVDAIHPKIRRLHSIYTLVSYILLYMLYKLYMSF